MVVLKLDVTIFTSLYFQTLWLNWIIFYQSFNTLVSGQKRGSSKKKHRNVRGFAQELLRSCLGYRPGRSVKRRSKFSSLHLKKKFWVGGADFSSVTS